MPKIHKYQDISEIDREAKRDLIDRHSPFIHCADTAVAGEPFEVTVKMGNEYSHPDDFDHYIESITLFYWRYQNFAQATYGSQGTLGKYKGHKTTTFTLITYRYKICNFVAHWDTLYRKTIGWSRGRGNLPG